MSKYEISYDRKKSKQIFVKFLLRKAEVSNDDVLENFHLSRGSNSTNWDPARIYFFIDNPREVEGKKKIEQLLAYFCSQGDESAEGTQ